MSNSSLIRYPGGKTKLKTQIVAALMHFVPKNTDFEYREPFFGGGSIGLEFITHSKINKVWINDKDAGIAALWTAVIHCPVDLKELVMAFKPSVEKYDEYKDELKQHPDFPQLDNVVEFGFKKLALHQISYSGLGTRSGGPLGGRNKDNFVGTTKIKFPINCRWSPAYLCKKIDKIHALFSRLDVRCTCLDFSALLEDGGESVMYLDPPYYKKGGELYECSFSEEDHQRLANLLIGCRRWVLSYDKCEDVERLYKWVHRDVIDVNYSIAKSTTKQELLMRAPLSVNCV